MKENRTEENPTMIDGRQKHRERRRDYWHSQKRAIGSKRGIQ